MSATRNRIRIPVDPADPYTGPFHLLGGAPIASPKFARSRATRIEVGVYDDKTWIQDVAGVYSSVTLEVKAAATRTAAPLISKTVGAASFVTTQVNEWINGTKQPIEFELSAGDTGLAMGGADELELWLVITGLSADGNVTLVAGPAQMIEDGGVYSGSTPTVGDPDYLTRAQTMALVQAISEGDIIRLSPSGQYHRRSGGVDDNGKPTDKITKLF